MSLHDALMAKAFGGGSGGGGGVSSWNDLTDKPFGESENAVLLPKTELVYVEAEGFFITPGYIEFVLGKTYTVNWNGVDYATECFEGAYNGMMLTGLGNPAAVGGQNNNLPFIVACMSGCIGAIPLDGSTAVTVGITGYELKKIPIQYAPKHTYTIEIPYGTSSHNNVISVDMDTSELVDVLLNGGNVAVDINLGIPMRYISPRFAVARATDSYATMSFTAALQAEIAQYGKGNVCLIIEAKYENLGYQIAING